MNKILFSCNSDLWNTPKSLFDTLDDEFHFNLDPCCLPESALCKRFFTPEDDGLEQCWGVVENTVVFCNPPYSNISNWVEKAFLEYFYNEVTVVLLLPAWTDTRWFHKYLYHFAEIRFIKGRLHFSGSKNPAPFPSMICILRPESRFS